MFALNLRRTGGRAITTGNTLDVYGDASDNDLASSSGVSYATARAGTGTLAINNGVAGAVTVVGQLLSGTTNYCFQGFWKFDLAAALVAAGKTTSLVTLTAVTLSGKVYVLSTETPVARRVMNAYLSNWGPTVATADFVAGASLGALTLLAHIDTTGEAVGSRYSFTNDALLASCDPTGTLWVLLAPADQAANAAPSGGEYTGFYSGDSATATDRPRLALTYSY